MDIRAGLAFLTVQFTHHTTGGVDLDPFGAGLAPQDLFLSRLKSDFADLETWNPQQVVRIFDPLEVIIADRANIAHHMREIRPDRIGAG